MNTQIIRIATTKSKCKYRNKNKRIEYNPAFDKFSIIRINIS